MARVISISIKAAPAAVYSAITSTEKTAEFTGMPARIILRKGGSFSAFGGLVSGSITAVARNKLVSFDIPAGVMNDAASITITLATRGNATKITVAGLESESLGQALSDYYLKPLKEYLEKN